MYYCIPVSFAQYIFFPLGKDDTVITDKYVIRNWYTQLKISCNSTVGKSAGQYCSEAGYVAYLAGIL